MPFLEKKLVTNLLQIFLPFISSYELFNDAVDGGFGYSLVSGELTGGYGLKMSGIKPSVCHVQDEL